MNGIARATLISACLSLAASLATAETSIQQLSGMAHVAATPLMGQFNAFKARRAADARAVALGVTDTFDFRIDVIGSKDGYDRIAGEGYQYTQTWTESHTRLVTEASSILAGLFLTQIQDTASKEAPDMLRHSQLTISEGTIPGRVLIKQEYVYRGADPRNASFIYDLHAEGTMEAQFTQGSWADFVAGRPVALELTQEGQQHLIEFLTSLYQQSLPALINHSYPTMSVQSISMRITDADAATIEGTNKHLAVRWPPTHTCVAHLQVLH